MTGFGEIGQNGRFFAKMGYFWHFFAPKWRKRIIFEKIRKCHFCTPIINQNNPAMLGFLNKNCCVKNHQNSSKSTFLELFDLIITENLFYFFFFIWNTYIVDCLFNVFICHPGPCDHFLDPFRGSCCVKITKNSSKSTVWPNHDWKLCLLFYFYMKYVLLIVSLTFSIVTLAHVTHIWTLSGGCVMSKWPISTFLAPFDILSLPRDPGIAGLFCQFSNRGHFFAFLSLCHICNYLPLTSNFFRFSKELVQRVGGCQ